MTTTLAEIAFFTKAIAKVFANDKDELKHAEKILSRHSDNIPLVLSKLNKLCGCDFASVSHYHNVSPSNLVAASIDDSVTSSGSSSSHLISLRSTVGSTTLSTTAQDHSNAINELNDANTYTPAGSLGSFYECSSLTDTSPTLIATGANTLAAMEKEKQKCTIWAFSKLIVTTDYAPNDALHPDYGDPSVDEDGFQDVFGSFSSTGPCFSVSRPEASLEGWNSAVAADSEMICRYALDH